jgi:hypothetical protein
MGHVVGEVLGRVAFGIDGDEQRLDALGRGAHGLQRRRHHLQFGRAHVGAVGEAEGDQHELAAERLVADALAGVGGEGEGPPTSAIPDTTTRGRSNTARRRRTPPAAPRRQARSGR